MIEDHVFSRAAVAAPHRFAAEAGRDVLAQGGNAIEAMVAMASTIALAYPHMNSLGGDGFWLIREARSGQVRAIEACGPAGALATRERYLAVGDAIPPRGPEAALTVPGTVGGWKAALDLSAALGGRLPLRVLLERAESLARDGLPVSPSETRFDPTAHPLLMAAPGFAQTYLVEGNPAKAGEIRKFPRLAATLAQLAHAGLDDFYRGDIGREIATDLETIGSPVTRADLTAYSARWREPLAVKLEKAMVYNTPAPTQGLASLILLALYERLAPPHVDGFEHAHALVEAFKRAATIRDRACVDFDIATSDFAELLSPRFLDREAEAIDKRRAGPFPAVSAPGDTVWMGAIDNNGLAVSFIQSVYWEYGSGCVLPGTGVVMANRGLAFPLEAGRPGSLRPGRRPFHTLNPPLAVLADKRVIAYGAMGGDGQPQFQAQTLTRILAGRTLADAVAAPRHLFGRSWGNPSLTLKLEAAYDDEIASALVRAGHEIERKSERDCDLFGHAGALALRPDGSIAATHDPRSDGGALGL